MTCFDTPFPQRSHFTHMPMFLGGVSVHPAHQAWYSAPFEDQFTDPTAFPHSVLVSLDFPSVVSVAATRFFRKCYATTAAGHTVVLVGGFRDCPSNRRIRRVLLHVAPVGGQDARLFLTFPIGSFPCGDGNGVAGTSGWCARSNRLYYDRRPTPPQSHPDLIQSIAFHIP